MLSSMSSKFLYKLVNTAIKWLFGAVIFIPLLLVLYLSLLSGYENFRAATGNPTERRIKKVTGYCSAQNRYLSDQELTDIAVTRLLGNLEENYLTLSEAEKAKQVRYRSLSHFYEVNPKCCPVITKPGDWEYGKARIARFKRDATYSIIRNSIHGHVRYQSQIQTSTDDLIYREYGYAMRFCGEHIGPPKGSVGRPTSTGGNLTNGYSVYPDRSRGK